MTAKIVEYNNGNVLSVKKIVRAELNDTLFLSVRPHQINHSYQIVCYEETGGTVNRVVPTTGSVRLDILLPGMGNYSFDSYSAFPGNTVDITDAANWLGSLTGTFNIEKVRFSFGSVQAGVLVDLCFVSSVGNGVG